MHTKSLLGQRFLIGFFLLLGSIFPVFVFASITNSPYPGYTVDDARFGFNGDTEYDFYGGTIFQATQDFTATGLEVSLCNTDITASNTASTIVRLYSLSSAPSDGDSIGGAVTATFIDDGQVNLQDSNGGSCFIPVSNPPVFAPQWLYDFDSDTLSDHPFVSGQWYMITLNESLIPSGSIDFTDLYIGVSTGGEPGYSVKLCKGLLCGSLASPYVRQGDPVPFINFTGVTTSSGSCTILAPLECIIDGLTTVFIPTLSFSDRWAMLPSLASSSPFSYLYDSKTIVTDLFGGSATTSAVIKVPFMGNDLVLLSQAKISAIPFSGTLLNLLTALAYLFGFSLVIQMIWAKLHTV